MMLLASRAPEREQPRHDPSELQETETPTGPRHSWYPPCKVLGEFVVSLILLGLSLPVIVLAALLVRVTSPGPAFYRQTRLGKNSRRYSIYKIRTMVHNCEALTGPRWATPDDPRITPVGRVLRAFHIDELPQLWNVLRGDMGLVGPRPERPELVPNLECSIRHYRRRLFVRPGMTGLAQVQLPPDSDLGSVRRKLVYDLYYVRELSPWLDLRILLCTACYLLGIQFHVAGRFLRVPHGETVERGAVDMEPEGAPIGQIEMELV